jgi:hypothetical protein
MNGNNKRTLRPGWSRPGISLTEMLVMLALLGIITDAAFRTVRVYGGGIRRSYRDFGTSMNINDMLRQLRRDVESARHLQQLSGDDEAANPVLAVTLPDRVVFYEFQPDKVARGLTVGDPNEPSLRIWPSPQTVFEWQVLARGDRVVAIEITSAIERVILDVPERKLRNSHVFFVGLANGVESEEISQ